MTLGYTAGSTVATTAEIYMVLGETVVPVFSGPFGPAGPPVSSGHIVFRFPALGDIGWFAWLTTAPGEGLCYDWDVVDTGPPNGAATAPLDSSLRQAVWKPQDGAQDRRSGGGRSE